jgi:HEAT repeat protein
MSQQGEHHIRASALTALSNFDDMRIIDPLLLALRDKRYDVRKAATDALVHLGNELVPSLEIALSDMEPHVRRAAASVLSQIGDRSAVQSLMSALTDEDASVRREVIIALAKLGGAEVIGALTHGLRDSDLDVKLAATAGLGLIGSIEAIPALLRVADDDYLVRTALESLCLIVQQHTSDIATEDLLAMAHFQPPPNLNEPQGALAASVEKHVVDPLLVIRLAQQELQLRGVSV